MSNEAIRSKKLIKNTFWAVFGHLIYAVAGFVSRSIFVNQLGDVITGVATLFSSILSLLSMVELGFGSAISVHLYKPVAENNKQKICALLNLYGRAYRIIAFSILGIGTAMLPVIHLFIKTDQYIDNLKLYFILYILKTVASYCFSYKYVILTVSQESHYKAKITNFVLVAVTILQAAVLHYTANFVVYLLIGILGTLITNIWITVKAEKCYPYIKAHKNAKVSVEERKSIVNYIKATAVDRIAIAMRSATDNIIISGVVDVAVTGIVGNYNMVITTVGTLLSFFYNNVLHAVGNMTATAEKRQQYNTLLDLQYLTFWLYGFLTTGMMCVLTPFVRDIWIRNPAMVVSQATLFWVLLSFFVSGITTPTSIFFTTTGMIKRMPLVNLSTVLVNLPLSLYLVKRYDVDGVFIGTVVSMLLTNVPLIQYYVLKYHFEGDFLSFIKKYLYYFLLTAISGAVSVSMSRYISETGLLGIILQCLLCAVIYNGIYFAVSFRTREFYSIFTLVKNLIFGRK